MHAALFEPRTASTYFTTHIFWDDEALWFQMDKYQFFQTSFSRFKVSVSGHWTCFISKVCQTVAGISVISELNEFSNLIFAGFCHLKPLCEARPASATNLHLSSARRLDWTSFSNADKKYFCQKYIQGEIVANFYNT